LPYLKYFQLFHYLSVKMGRPPQSSFRPAQMVNQSPQMVSQPAQMVNQSAQMVNQSAQMVSQPAQMVNQSAQMVNQPVEMVNQPAQMVSQPQPQLDSNEDHPQISHWQSTAPADSPEPGKTPHLEQMIISYVDGPNSFWGQVMRDNRAQELVKLSEDLANICPLSSAVSGRPNFSKVSFMECWFYQIL
jgi:hypothetical protein